MSSKLPRPFWKRKRWIAAVVLFLVLAYPASFGPFMYCIVRGWLPADPVYSYLNDVVDVFKRLDGHRSKEPISLTQVYYYYLEHFVDLAYMHAPNQLPGN